MRRPPAPPRDTASARRLARQQNDFTAEGAPPPAVEPGNADPVAAPPGAFEADPARALPLDRAAQAPAAVPRLLRPYGPPSRKRW